MGTHTSVALTFLKSGTRGQMHECERRSDSSPDGRPGSCPLWKGFWIFHSYALRTRLPSLETAVARRSNASKKQDSVENSQGVPHPQLCIMTSAAWNLDGLRSVRVLSDFYAVVAGVTGAIRNYRGARTVTHSRAPFMKGRPHTALRLTGSRSPRKLLFSRRAIDTPPQSLHLCTQR